MAVARGQIGYAREAYMAIDPKLVRQLQRIEVKLDRILRDLHPKEDDSDYGDETG